MGAMLTMGYVTLLHDSSLDSTRQGRPFGWYVRFSSGVSGITTASSSTRQMSPGFNLRRDTPTALSASRMPCYLPTFPRMGRHFSKTRSWWASRSLASPRTERSTGNSRRCSILVFGRAFGRVAMRELLRFRERLDMSVYLYLSSFESATDSFNGLQRLSITWLPLAGIGSGGIFRW
jgi:hypothetical protein